AAPWFFRTVGRESCAAKSMQRVQEACERFEDRMPLDRGESVETRDRQFLARNKPVSAEAPVARYETVVRYCDGACAREDACHAELVGKSLSVERATREAK